MQNTAKNIYHRPVHQHSNTTVYHQILAQSAKVCFRKETQIFTVFQNKLQYGLVVSMQIMLTPY